MGSQDGSTHWEGCYEAHLPCAVARIKRLEYEVMVLRSGLNTLAGKIPESMKSELITNTLRVASEYPT